MCRNSHGQVWRVNPVKLGTILSLPWAAPTAIREARAGASNISLTFCVLLFCLILSHSLSFSLILPHSLSFSLIHSHCLSFCRILSHPLSFSLSFPLILSQSPSFSLVLPHSDRSRVVGCHFGPKTTKNLIETRSKNQWKIDAEKVEKIRQETYKIGTKTGSKNYEQSMQILM